MGRAWTHVIFGGCGTAEMQNELEAAVREHLDLNQEVAGVCHSASGDVLLIFRPIPQHATHVTATLVDRSGYPR